ncbi:hypothetical protein CEXT_156201 [Caerostris extrusa]|uniref:Uncharacterized protein n=1 Tax=Caerostris extrusa TaxID=172846 RepID=A0AAV4Y6D7_CAEEX|nr:hypothetical protein CEXT_156201 [Caerostris extrusa]
MSGMNWSVLQMALTQCVSDVIGPLLGFLHDAESVLLIGKANNSKVSIQQQRAVNEAIPLTPLFPIFSGKSAKTGKKKEEVKGFAPHLEVLAPLFSRILSTSDPIFFSRTRPCPLKKKKERNRVTTLTNRGPARITLSVVAWWGRDPHPKRRFHSEMGLGFIIIIEAD